MRSEKYQQEYMKKWRADNRDKIRKCKGRWRIINREKLREYAKKYRVDNPGKVRDHGRNNDFGSAERYEEAMLKYDGWCAFACDKKAEMVHHLDGRSTRNRHETFSKIDNTLENLIPLCRGCHSRLHNTKIKEHNQ